MVTSDLQCTTDRQRAQPLTDYHFDPMAHSSPADRRPLPLEAALERVGDRWSLLLVEALLDGPRRFGDLAASLPGIAPNILTDRLRRLERAGILRPSPYQERPIRYVYELTADGRALASALRLLADWGARRASDIEPLRHGVCGTPLEARYWCPTCTAMVDASDAAEERIL